MAGGANLMAGTSIIISIVLGFVFSELTGWFTGGLVVPGYLALYVNQPLRIVMTYAAAALAFFAVKLLARVTILFGRRRFMAFILAGICAGALLDMMTGMLPPSGSDLRAIDWHASSQRLGLAGDWLCSTWTYRKRYMEAGASKDLACESCCHTGYAGGAAFDSALSCWG